MSSKENHPLHRIFHPRSIAVFGASNKPTTMGTYQLLNILSSGYQGKVYPVHPKLSEVQGLKAYPSARELPEAPDLALITIPRDAVLEVFKDLGERGCQRAIVISGGFKEVGEEGREKEQELVKIARSYGIRFVGPNCIGIINPWLPLNTTMYPYKQNPGYIGLASHSGTYVTQVLPWLEKSGIGYARAVSLGNEADLNIVDAIEYYGEDEQVKSIALYIEGIRRPKEFLKVAKRVSRKKPIVALYVGGTRAGARSGVSHTGALSGSDEIYQGVFNQCRIIRAPDVASLYEWAFALATQPPLKGKRIAICTHSGGPATSLADACERAGFEVREFSPKLQKRIRQLIPATGSARNPVDMTFSVNLDALYFQLPELILSSGEVDGLILHGIEGESYYTHFVQASHGRLKIPVEELSGYLRGILKKLAQLPARFSKPIVSSSFMGREDSAVALVQDLGIPCYPSPERAVLAMKALYLRGQSIK